ncbi:MAG: Gfo/Idh/MocA family oxidoreductase [Alistipes sp.]|jgi:predicted dehydrogenase|nr:Gfo/Idh/MocA family oxidoreductase [Alistipes sp.]
MKKLLLVALLCAVSAICFGQDRAPLRVAIAGVAHGHVGAVNSAARDGEIELVGIFEKDPEVRAANSLAKRYPDMVYDDLGAMLDAVRPEAVMAYGSVFDHLSVVEACAPRGIHVMVEKPLAVSGDHARKMARLARENNIHLLTNYETTWYPTNHRAYEIVTAGEIGDITRMTIYDGHQGPVEIGCGPEFLAWLTDPVLNGGGAVVDFGCYGANLATWLLGGQRPVSVYAVLKQLKPELYPRVDDDATILVEYPDCTVEIMASWSWPMGRKDMHIYGEKGYVYQDNARDMRVGTEREVTSERPGDLPASMGNPFLYLTAVVRGEIVPRPDDLSALENNLTVVEILDAARESARTKKAVKF